MSESVTFPGIGGHVRRNRQLICGDYQHLKQVGSPFSVLVNEKDLAYCQFADQLRELVSHRGKVVSLAASEPEDFLHSIYAEPKLLENSKPKIFDSLAENEIQRLIKKSHIIEVLRGDRIIEKDNAARTMFVLLSGVAEVRRNNELQAVISPGELIGEIAFFLNVPRSATIVAVTDDVRVLSLDESSMSRLLKFDSELASKILMNISRSLCYRVVKGIETTDLNSESD